MSAPPKLENCSSVLIVEGYSDLLFYAELLEATGKVGGVFIKQFNGQQDLATKLETFLTPQLLSSKAAIGVIVDANGNVSQAISGTENLLSQLTSQQVSNGLWTSGNPRIGLFVAPDGNSSGEIETLVWRAWAADPQNTQPKQCIETYIQCMRSAGFVAQSEDKGLVSSLLAIRNDEDPRLGPGARANVFDFTRPEYERLKSFLSQI